MNFTKHENGIYTWPTLYKMGSKKAEQQWDIAVISCPKSANCEKDWANIRVKHGQVNGKIQCALQAIYKGKNLGKANATTPEQQAVSESEAKWLKQQDKGYSVERGGGSMELKPMLAHSYQDIKKDTITFPAYVQPKLDGVRCIAHKQSDGKVALWSRQSKEHKGLNHIREALSVVMRIGDVWDGELYVHGMAFQRVISLVKKDQPDSDLLQYHIYDSVTDERFDVRFQEFADKVEENVHECLCIVDTYEVQNNEEVQSFHGQFVSAGYEGAMLRVGDCTYTQGYRSRQLLKVKAFTDGEFEIVGIRDGKGKFEGRAVFQCKTEIGTVFEATPKGRDELRQRYYEDREKLIGKKLTVKYFEWTTSVNPVPRFPIAIAVRDYE